MLTFREVNRIACQRWSYPKLCKGAKKYLVLPIGEPHGVVIEERWLKSRRDKKNERCAWLVQHS